MLSGKFMRGLRIAGRLLAEDKHRDCRTWGLLRMRDPRQVQDRIGGLRTFYDVTCIFSHPRSRKKTCVLADPECVFLIRAAE
jgi:hypothetical protein